MSLFFYAYPKYTIKARPQTGDLAILFFENAKVDFTSLGNLNTLSFIYPLGKSSDEKASVTCNSFWKTFFFRATV